MRVPFSLHPGQHFLLVVFLGMVFYRASANVFLQQLVSGAVGKEWFLEEMFL
jgi:hypothetical protein